MIHWCFTSLVVAALIWYSLRKLVRLVTSNDEIVLLVDELSGNIFSGVFIMELGILATHHGTYSLAHVGAGFIMLFIRNSYFTYESVCAFVDSYYSNGRKVTISFIHMLLNILVQISGFLIGQYLARFFWTFEDHTHTEALSYVCETAMSPDHPFHYVAFAEFFGPFTMCLAAYMVPRENQNLVPLVVTTVAYINFYFFTHMSGSFYNQSLATAFTFQCKGHRSDLEFLGVYWLAPTLGQIVAWELLSVGSKVGKVGDAEKKKAE